MLLQKGNITYCFSVESRKIGARKWFIASIQGSEAIFVKSVAFFPHLLTLKSHFKQKNPAEWFNCWEVLCAVCQINCTSFSIQNEWWALRIRETALKYAWILWQWMVFNPDSGYIESQEVFCRQVALLLTPSNLS